MAAGVVVICVGDATRLIELVQSRPKSYRGTFLLGKRSDTDDLSGQVIEGDSARAATVTRAELDAILPDFRGRIEQVPPVFSAVRIEGLRAYQLARWGKEVTLSARAVEVLRLEVVRFEPPELTLDIECGSGTYIRSIGRDLGERLGCGAVMSALVRMQVGPFDQASGLSISHLTAESLEPKLLPCIAATSHLPAYVCDQPEIAQLCQGQGIAPRDSAWQRLNTERPEACALVNATGDLLAIGGWDHVLPKLRPRINFIAIRGGNEPPNDS